MASSDLCIIIHIAAGTFSSGDAGLDETMITCGHFSETELGTDDGNPSDKPGKKWMCKYMARHMNANNNTYTILIYTGTTTCGESCHTGWTEIPAKKRKTGTKPAKKAKHSKALRLLKAD